MNRPTIYIGIDPDTIKSGVSIIDTIKKTVSLYSMHNGSIIYNLFEHFALSKDTKIVIEAGWLNPSNWHAKSGQNHRLSASIGSRTGANHEAGRILVDCAKMKGHDVIEQKPLRKSWNGREGKITHAEIESIVKNAGYTFPNKSNQETRDATLIAWHTVGLPMQISPK